MAVFGHLQHKNALNFKASEDITGIFDSMRIQEGVQLFLPLSNIEIFLAKGKTPKNGCTPSKIRTDLIDRLFISKGSNNEKFKTS